MQLSALAGGDELTSDVWKTVLHVCLAASDSVQSCTSKLHTWSVCKGCWVKSGWSCCLLIKEELCRNPVSLRFLYALELVCTPRGKRATHPILFPSSLTPILPTTHSPTLRMPARDKSREKTHVLCYAYSCCCCCCCWFFERHSSCHLSVVYGSQSAAVKERVRGRGDGVECFIS